ncbi:hypothetical protein ACH3O9_09655 [Leeuwenhoekiella sp. A16]|uniref:hypothetical protein n=1 Tax=Leeuwenhoekiella sp. A16 TaxID=3141462 RepID=UPI003A809408|tara:strand:- start:46 stop:276 length:231 start_codon:yes stop_codon:yes gene_type:complete
MMKKYIALLIVLFLTATPVEAQCAMCRAVLESETDNSIAQGVNNGIIYLMAVPYLLMGGLIWYIYKSRKKADKADN